MIFNAPLPFCGGIFDWDRSLARLQVLNERAEDPALWNDSTKAQELMRERQQLQAQFAVIEGLRDELDDALTLYELGVAEEDTAAIDEAEALIRQLGRKAAREQIQTLLSGEADGNDAFVEIHAGAGGTESQDWAEMLLRMYMRWGERRGYRVSLVEISAGEEAGIKSATIRLEGSKAYGWAKTESGVHRLVRISPFDSNARRHTSFASVWVYPVVDDRIAVEVNEADVRIDTYRASGAGGQHVNTTDSAVRITHLPSGIVVQCQNERSQHKNRATAWTMLRARLYEAELQRREEQASGAAAAKTDIGWGHQIRSYVLQPYRIVKDLRTNLENTNPDAVLDGDLDGFMEAALAHRIGSESALGDGAEVD